MMVAAVALAALAVVPGGADARLVGENPWLAASDDGFLNIAHRGGGAEWPEHTLFAYSESIPAGVEMLEADVYLSADGELIVIHDATVDRTTNGSGAVNDMTVEELKALDNAYWFCPDSVDCEADGFPYRGIATGHVPPPTGYDANDFKLLTLREALAEFPDVPFTIELKPNETEVGAFEAELADVLVEMGRTDDVIVASFIDVHTEAFKALAPDVSTSFPTVQAATFSAASAEALPGRPARHDALQVPINFSGVPVVSQDYVDDAHANGLAVHVWTVNSCEEMVWLLDLGVDGIMTDYPTRLQAVLDARVAGTADCATIG
jgi:glycerophosphoryl diester phosphodiesterase